MKKFLIFLSMLICIPAMADTMPFYIDSIPNSVSINEAVELCKKYATQEDASFVNGILASVVKA